MIEDTSKYQRRSMRRSFMCIDSQYYGIVDQNATHTADFLPFRFIAHKMRLFNPKRPKSKYLKFARVSNGAFVSRLRLHPRRRRVYFISRISLAPFARVVYYSFIYFFFFNHFIPVTK